MPKSNLKEAFKTLRHYLKSAYTRNGTGPAWGGDEEEDMDNILRAFEQADAIINRSDSYPPIDDKELVNSQAFDAQFDRIVIAQNGIFGRRVGSGIWTRLRTVAEQEKIREAEEAAKEAARAAAEAKAAAQ